MAKLNGKDVLFSPRIIMTGGTDIEIVQTTGDSETKVMSQKAVTEELAKINTGEPGESVEIVQTPGDSESAVMSQKAVTEELERINSTYVDKKALSTVEKRLTNLEGATLDFTEDSTVAYKKTVPTGVEKYALVNGFCGKSYTSENLMPRPYYDGEGKNIYGITYTVQDDGGIKMLGTANSPSNNAATFRLFDVDYQTVGFGLEHGKTYRLSVSGLPKGSLIYFSYKNANGEIKKVEKNTSFTWDSTYNLHKCYLQINNTYTADNDVVYVMLNEGDAQPYKPYFEGIRDSKVTAIVSKGYENLFKPDSVSSNELSYNINEDNTITINGTLTMPTMLVIDIPDTPLLENHRYTFSIDSPYFNFASFGFVYTTETDENPNINLIQFYDNTSGTKEFGINKDYIIDEGYGVPLYDKVRLTSVSIDLPSGTYNNETVRIAVVDTIPTKEIVTIVIPEEIQNHEGYGADGSYIDFEQMKLKIGDDITDISHLFDDNFIEVEGGGIIEFVNEYGYAVPSTISYVSAIGG